MELIFLLPFLYPMFLAFLHLPMIVSYFVLKRFKLLRPWHFMVTCSLIFVLGHVAAGWALLGHGIPLLSVLLGLFFGTVCGLTWWYILVKKI